MQEQFPLTFINKHTRQVKRFAQPPGEPWVYLSPVSQYTNDKGEKVWRMEAGKMTVEVTEVITNGSNH